MPRLIDADKLHYHRVWIASIKDGEYNGMKSDVVVFAREIDKNKKARVDAVPVVRCRDCIHNYANMVPGGEGCAKCTELPIAPDFFCKSGERKGGDE